MTDFLAIDIIDIGVIKRDKLNIETKNKACSVLSCRISGYTLLDTGNRILNIKKGDILYIPKGSCYSQKTSGEEIVYIHFEALGDKLSEIQHIISEEPEVTTEFFKKLSIIWANKEKNYKYICTSLLYELIAKTSIILPQGNDDILEPAMQYIKEHFCDSDFSLEIACKKSNISRSYFNRIFKKRFSVSPTPYINQLKIEKAKFLLSCKSYTHNEISTLCGFNNTKYFYSVFKKTMNTTIKKFQKENENIDFFKTS